MSSGGWVAEVFDASDARLAEAFALRVKVFVEERRVPSSLHSDQYDRSRSDSVHALIRDDHGQAIAAGRYYVREDRAIHIGRIAVLASERSKGIGAALLHALMDEAKGRGFTRAVIHSQSHNRGFFEREGFVAFGEPFPEFGIPHIAMERDLQ